MTFGWQRFLLTVPLGLAAACGHTEVHHVLLRASAEHPTSARAEIYFGHRLPERPFYEVGLVQAVGYGSDANLDTLVAALSARAKELGCDALVRVRVDAGITRQSAVGGCVRWSPTSATPVPLPPAPPVPSAPPQGPETGADPPLLP